MTHIAGHIPDTKILQLLKAVDAPAAGCSAAALSVHAAHDFSQASFQVLVLHPHPVQHWVTQLATALLCRAAVASFASAAALLQTPSPLPQTPPACRFFCCSGPRCCCCLC